MATDPICGMTVDKDTALQAEVDGKTYYFCSLICKNKFLGASYKKIDNLKYFEYTCPMHPEILQNKPGDCPKCGMPLELKSISAADEEDNKETRILARKFWIGLILTSPVFFLSIGEMVHFVNWKAVASSELSRWLQFIFATPVVLWAGNIFFVKAWKSVLNKSLNMFTLIAMGVGAAYGFSAIAILFPNIFPESLKTHGEIGLYFEAAAVITVLVLMGQLLEAKARNRTGQAI